MVFAEKNKKIEFDEETILEEIVCCVGYADEILKACEYYHELKD